MAWATVLLFVTKGNTRASMSGTARLQSRFLYVYVCTNIVNNYTIMEESRKSNKE